MPAYGDTLKNSTSAISKRGIVTVHPLQAFCQKGAVKTLVFTVKDRGVKRLLDVPKLMKMGRNEEHELRRLLGRRCQV